MNDDELEGADPTLSSGLTRRNALRAGFAGGVGLVAWTGASITSLGGTPAYAQASSGALPPIDLAGGCRNTDKGGGGGGCDFRYHQSVVPPLPPGFTFGPAVPEGTCCDAGFTAVFTFPTDQDLSCTVTITFFESSCSPPPITALLYGPSTDGTINVPFTCTPTNLPPQASYRVTGRCVPIAPP